VRALISIALALLLTGCATRPEAPSGEFPNESLTVGSAKREYWIFGVWIARENVVAEARPRLGEFFAAHPRAM